MGIAQAIKRGQRMAESMMAETVRIDRVLGRTTDDDGRTVAQLLSPPVYQGKAKVQTYEPYESASDVAGSTVVMQRYSIHIPAEAGPVEVGDFITLLSATAGDDRVFRVGGTHRKTYQTAQRLLCDVQTGGIQP